MPESLSIPGRTTIIQEHKNNGGKVAAILPYHYPRPLITAFDILPVEVWGPPRVDTSYGSAHLQPYICSIVRNALSFLLTGGLVFLIQVAGRAVFILFFEGFCVFLMQVCNRWSVQFAENPHRVDADNISPGVKSLCGHRF